MSMDGAQETFSSGRAEHQPPVRRRGGAVRTLVYIVIVCLLGFVVWRIYTNQKQQQSQAQAQAAAIFNRPVPVQVAMVDSRPMPIFLTALGTVTPYMSVTVKARVSGRS